MRTRHLLCLPVVLLLFMLSATSAFAQDAPTVPEPVDNLCAEGQLWDDGRCEIPAYEGASDLAWTCGWYMARILDGRLPASALVRGCGHLLTSSSGGVTEICTLLAPGNLLCFRSDQTGTLTVNGTPFLQYRFLGSNPGSSAGCPALTGYSVLIVEPTSVQEARFTPDQLYTRLSLGGYYCLYVATT